MTKSPANKLASALRILDELTDTQEGKQIARDFGAQCAEMKIYEAVRISRLLEASFREGRRIGRKEAVVSMSETLKRIA